MNPPPPPFRFRPRDDFTMDPALDDRALSRARDALAMGRWTEARSLLAATGRDWDRRAHRVTVLAEPAARSRWADEWLMAEPDSADAAVLAAHAAVVSAVRGEIPAADAEAACTSAARSLPEDPTPWYGLLLLVRHTSTDSGRLKACFDQVRSRDPWHHGAHHAMTAWLAERRESAADDPFHEVYEFADQVVWERPPGSPLAMLPVIAHAERFRVLMTARQLAPDIADSLYWTSARARRGLRLAFDWWLEGEGRDHARLKLDLNYLAHAKYHEGRTTEAAALFNVIGPHATREPWAYGEPDAAEAFRRARARARGGRPGS
ncbi:hypothetical protein GCM10010406_07120 [Streptomyces thermolineatus]|uniref:DUF4034 domain-containing protein n=1 Tax=Streptomyces thermolineatus TaxID=44033 RepID=A0ABN3KZY7_9ACTN|nr:hypothetical protein [Streptomyces sp. HB2AG]MCZ2527747.1 hypothetical protein [Streptomyces sp. HB2AG]